MNNITILYVEDEPSVRDSLSEVLSCFCSRVITACDGLEGLEAYKKYNPDIIVSDIQMPNMNGIEMAKAIKDIDPEQYIIFTTAHSESRYFIESINLQVDGYILKPVDLEQLETKISSLAKMIKLKKDFKAQQIIINEIATLQDNMLVVMDNENKPIFSNKQFLDFISVDNIKQFSLNYSCLCDLFIKEEDFFYPAGNAIQWKEEILKMSDDKRVVSIMDTKTSSAKSFLVSVKLISDSLHTIIIFTEITNIAALKNEYKEKAYTDELTSAYNRTYFNEELKKEILRYKRDNAPLCFIILDIDFFKEVNDTHGHNSGDDILKELTSLVHKQTRVTDTFARWGGEEFVKLLPNTTLEKAKLVAEKLRTKIQKHNFSDGLKITCSFGVAEIKDEDSKECLIKRADTALYIAKSKGRNRVES
ncbi:MAG: diguanylate cyclase [Campylobacterota bacterium]|nr:diguanylate cyclase [Campylobacterota bacterium]